MDPKLTSTQWQKLQSLKADCDHDLAQLASQYPALATLTDSLFEGGPELTPDDRRQIADFEAGREAIVARYDSLAVEVRNPVEAAFYLHKHDTGHEIFLVIDHRPEPSELTVNLGGDAMVYADGSPVKTSPGWTLGPVSNRNEAEILAQTLAKRFNWDVMVDNERLGLNLDYIERREAAARLGSARTPEKAAAARENGKKGGRPKSAA